MHDTDNFRFIGKNGIIQLTVKENKILELLIANKHNTVSYKELIKKIYNHKYSESYRKRLALCIYRIKKKLQYEFYIDIQAVREIGYILL